MGRAPSSPNLRLVSRTLRSAFGSPPSPGRFSPISRISEQLGGGARSRPLSSAVVLTYPAAPGHASLVVRRFKGNTSQLVSCFPLRLLCPQSSLSHWRAAPSFSCCASHLEVIRDLSFPHPHVWLDWESRLFPTFKACPGLCHFLLPPLWPLWSRPLACLTAPAS